MSEHITELGQVPASQTEEAILTLQDDDPNCQAVYRGNNEERYSYTVFRTDQGNANPEKRCDFLLVDAKQQRAWYIELKGRNHWDIACQQLLRTHLHFTPQLGFDDHNLRFRLVASSARSGMKVFRSYTSYRNLIMYLPSSKQFGLMFSSRSGNCKDYEVLESTSIIPVDEELVSK